jgi:hypothetical protein
MLTSIWSALAQAGAYDVRWRWFWLAWCFVAMAAILATAIVWWGRESGALAHARHVRHRHGHGAFSH